MTENFRMERKETLQNGELINVLCFVKSKKQGFQHIVKAFFDGKEFVKKINYINRTWEARPFDLATQTLLKEINKSIKTTC